VKLITGSAGEPRLLDAKTGYDLGKLLTIVPDEAKLQHREFVMAVRGMLKLATAVCGAAAVVLIGASGAFAASPTTIYKDYADNGRLDGRYSAADLRAALKNAVIQGYGGPTGEQMAGKIKQQLGSHNGAFARQQQAGASTLKEGRTARGTLPFTGRKAGGTLPFTGRDLAVIVATGLALLLFGAGLRQLGRATT
jgi:hypothetical protein